VAFQHEDGIGLASIANGPASASTRHHLRHTENSDLKSWRVLS